MWITQAFNPSFLEKMGCLTPLFWSFNPSFLEKIGQQKYRNFFIHNVFLNLAFAHTTLYTIFLTNKNTTKEDGVFFITENQKEKPSG